ncbi:DUF2188 domain-containing protein [Halalkalibacterium ligniniphilum]|uniref:DUF2188 domain-containing protein n=1 Tax=Halalkalibacterium ligniniphilum TaxID=1134413 RepID=UPI00034B1827|nr:DUF2188 domain-containing protein [Halalkalibacterium ligniniphilum]
MKEFHIVPNKEMTEWQVRLEGVAPEYVYMDKDQAIKQAELLAKEQAPSRTVIFNHLYEVIEEKTFNE